MLVSFVAACNNAGTNTSPVKTKQLHFSRNPGQVDVQVCREIS